jgi:S-disulfanyl-L-cysteine oxidoreductase SoxD
MEHPSCLHDNPTHDPAMHKNIDFRAGATFVAAALGLALVPGLALAPGLSAQTPSEEPAGPAVYTKVQADEGRELYDIQCTICHAPREFSGGVFQRRWLTPPVSGIFVHILNTMPQDAPGSLSREEVAAIVAYILEMNGQPAGQEPLPTETEKLTQIRVTVGPDEETPPQTP